MKTHIPVHTIDEFSEVGIRMLHFEMDNRKNPALLGIHRDEYYIFIFQQEGLSRLMMDFRMISGQGPGLIYITPGQVHHIISTEYSCGWFLAVATHLIEEEYRQIFEQLIVNQDFIPVDAATQENLEHCAGLLFKKYSAADQPLYKQIINALVSSYIGMFAVEFLKQKTETSQPNSRPVQLTRQFRTLLLEQFRTVKAPSAYAEQLNISLTYLSEVVKAVTGFSVSHWIHYEVILEAKRMLYYTDLSLKQIAFDLGFADHAYFSRLFTKIAGVSAGKFRSGYRESSKNYP